MNDQNLNGTAAPTNPLSEAIKRHGRLLLKSSTLPNGVIAINAASMMCDIELLAARIEILFEALAKRGLVDGKEMIDALRDRLNAASDEMQEYLDTPQLQIAR